MSLGSSAVMSLGSSAVMSLGSSAVMTGEQCCNDWGAVLYGVSLYVLFPHSLCQQTFGQVMPWQPLTLLTHFPQLLHPYHSKAQTDMQPRSHHLPCPQMAPNTNRTSLPYLTTARTRTPEMDQPLTARRSVPSLPCLLSFPKK